MRISRRTWMFVIGLGVLTATLVLVVMYRTALTPLSPPAEVVHNVLELRSERSSDASAYAEYFSEVSIAVLLAQDATASVPATASRDAAIPAWERPYVSAQTSSTADVVVKWKPNSDFKDWAKATLFKLEKRASAWKVIDAEELSASIPPESGSEDATGKP